MDGYADFGYKYTPFLRDPSSNICFTKKVDEPTDSANISIADIAVNETAKELPTNICFVSIC
jgi:hypothetical protein